MYDSENLCNVLFYAPVNLIDWGWLSSYFC